MAKKRPVGRPHKGVSRVPCELTAEAEAAAEMARLTQQAIEGRAISKIEFRSRLVLEACAKYPKK